MDKKFEVMSDRAVVPAGEEAPHLLEGRDQRVVLEVQPLQHLKLREADRQLLDPVSVEVERLELTELAKVLW